MKKAVLLHGTDGSPSYSWFPWVKKELEARGYEVWAPTLPDNHAPNRKKYETYLRNSSWDFTDNLVIGHSSGATTALNLLSSEWFPHVRATVLVGTFLNERALTNAEWYEPGQFDNLFPESGFDFQEIRTRSNDFYLIHGDDDPYCLLEDAKLAANELKGELTIVRNGLHLSANRTELPEMIPIFNRIS